MPAHVDPQPVPLHRKHPVGFLGDEFARDQRRLIVSLSAYDFGAGGSALVSSCEEMGAEGWGEAAVDVRPRGRDMDSGATGKD